LRLIAGRIAGVALAVWATMMVVAGPASAAGMHAGQEAEPRPPVSSDAQRRRLNDRLGQMVRDGRSGLPEAVSSLDPATRAGASTLTRSDARRRPYRAPTLDLTTPPRVPQSDVECLTQAIYYEARNESEEGQAAVAEVVMNRSRALGYPPRVCEVVYQRNSRTCQFTFTCDGSIGRGPINPEAWARAEAIARSVYEGTRPSLLPPRSLNYHANYVRPSWASRLEQVRQIGTHIFYGDSLTGGPRPGATATEAPGSSGGLVFTRNAALDEAYARAMQPGS